jgi:hypothetical protein
MKIPMPSPRGTNDAGLYLRRPFFRGPAAAYDEAPDGSRRAMLRRKARRFFEERWRAQWEDFCEATGLGLEDEPAEDESVTEPQHRAISAAASMQPATEDELPEYGPNGLPRNNIAARRPGAMDELRRLTAHIVVEREPKPRQPPRTSESVRRRVEAIAPGLAGIKTGPI